MLKAWRDPYAPATPITEVGLGVQNPNPLYPCHTNHRLRARCSAPENPIPLPHQSQVGLSVQHQKTYTQLTPIIKVGSVFSTKKPYTPATPITSRVKRSAPKTPMPLQHQLYKKTFLNDLSQVQAPSDNSQWWGFLLLIAFIQSYSLLSSGFTALITRKSKWGWQ